MVRVLCDRDTQVAVNQPRVHAWLRRLVAGCHSDAAFAVDQSKLRSAHAYRRYARLLTRQADNSLDERFWSENEMPAAKN